MATIKDINLLFDPYITPNKLASHIDISTIEPDYILLSHGHGDHIADAEALALASGAELITNFEVGNWFENKGIKTIHSMNQGGSKAFPFGTVKCVNAIHSSSMPDGSYGGNPIGFVISSGEKNFYYSGDTALTMDMQLVPLFSKIDFCVFPIGDNFTMGAAEAVEAAKMVKCNKVIGVHYDTFGPIEIDKAKATAVFEKGGITLLLPAIGETIDI